MVGGIRYSQGLIQSLEVSLRSAFNPSLILNRRPAKPGPAFQISVQEGDKIAQTDEGSEQEVKILLANGNPSSFYFGFASTFDIIAHEYTLQHSSLTVFHDIGELTPLFRADWDPRAASDATSEHAQPHWHFVQRPESIESIVRMMISPSTEFAPEQTSELFAGLADCGKFHFAMSPLWDQHIKPSYKQIFDSDDFRMWFENLANYIAGQIAYIIKKAPSATPREFVPQPLLVEWDNNL